MTELTKRLLKTLARSTLGVICRLFGKETLNQEPGAGIPASRKPLTHKQTKRSKGEVK